MPLGPKPRDYAQEYYHSFRGDAKISQEFDYFGADGDRYVKFEPAGLHVSLSRGEHAPGSNSNHGLVANVSIRGDFEITLGFELANEPPPQGAQLGTGIIVGIDLDTPEKNQASLSRVTRWQSKLFTTYVVFSPPGADKPLPPPFNSYPTQAAAGRLRIVRNGSEVSYFVSEDTGKEFTFLRTDQFRADAVKQVRIIGTVGGPEAWLDARVIDLRVRADAIAGAEVTTHFPSPLGVPETQGAGRHDWLVVGSLVGAASLLSLALSTGVALYLRRRRRAGQAPAPASPKVPQAAAAIGIPCPGCRKNLKVKAELAGKRVKCPHCGGTVLAPEATAFVAQPIPAKKKPPSPSQKPLLMLLSFVTVLPLAGGSVHAQVVPVVEDTNSIPPRGTKEAQPVRKIEDVPQPRENYAQKYYHSFKDNPDDTKDFELIGPNANECVKFEPAGLRIVLPAGHSGQRLSTGVTSRFAVKGDFEITLTYEVLKEGQGSGLFLGIDLNTLSYNRASLTRGLRDSRQFLTWFQQSREGSDKPYRDELCAFPSAGMAARLRLVRTGSVLAHYVAEGVDDKYTLLWHHPFGTEDVRTVRLGGQTSGFLDARMIDVRVRADSLPEMPDVPLAAQQSGVKLWLLVMTSISFSALVSLGIWLYVPRRGALPATIPASASENGGQADALTTHVSFACSTCGRKLRARSDLAGKRRKCPHCGLVVLFPSNTTSRASNVPPAEHP